MPVILAIQEAEIRRTTVQSQPRQIVPKTLFWKNPSQTGAGGVVQVKALRSNPSTQTQQQKKLQCLM
jgi:hypothetical protein